MENEMAYESAHAQIRIEPRNPFYWRIIIDNPPFNIFGPDTMPQLNAAVTALETDPHVKVVVFESAVPGFFLTHYDFVPPLEATTSMPPGPTGLPPLPDMLVRLGRTSVISIAKIRGRATGVGSELALASDMRFASNEGTLLSQWEIGAALVPGGGPMTRLSRLIGRGRALEVLVSGNDIDGPLAERYGYVNRSFPDAELDDFVDALATRIASFDKQSLAAIKQQVNTQTLPPDSAVAPDWDAFIASVGRPAAQEKIAQLMELGLQKNHDVEARLGYYTGTLWR
jgi:enoyl-CoA hydratase/carnithine racemase